MRMKQYVRIEKKNGTCLKGSTNGIIKVYIDGSHVIAKQYVLTGDEMQALVDFMREVSELVMGPPVDFEGQDPEDMGDRTGLPKEGDFEVGGYLSTAACDRVDEVLHKHGIKL
jgi:hypothetical protein